MQESMRLQELSVKCFPANTTSFSIYIQDKWKKSAFMCPSMWIELHMKEVPTAAAYLSNRKLLRLPVHKVPSDILESYGG